MVVLSACGGGGGSSDDDGLVILEREGVTVIHPADTTFAELRSPWLAVLDTFQIAPLAATTRDIHLELI